MLALLSRLIFLIAVSVMLSSAGCSDADRNQPMSMDEALASLEQARKDSQQPPPPIEDSDGTESEEEEELGSDEVDETVPQTGTFTVRVESSAGDYTIEVHRDWAPRGAERFYQLVKAGYYDECRYFRVVPDFMVQFGMHGNPETHRQWDRNIRDDAVKQSNKRGFVTFATSGKHSRTTQIFINYSDNSRLDSMGFAPFGKVTEGMEHVDSINPKHGESPAQRSIEDRGNAYLQQNFPDLDFVKKMTIVSEASE
ncbi:MAG: peptidylprolyl isomerase [Planctomycetaceae bacterium]|nr:peptidylprolyl isomerase [Planctomycetaceae bacterium]